MDWISIVLFALVFIIAVYFAATKQWERLKQLAYILMLQAERLYDSEAGKEKFESVFKTLYGFLPAWVKILLPEAYLRQKLQEWYNEAKEYLLN